MLAPETMSDAIKVSLIVIRGSESQSSATPASDFVRAVILKLAFVVIMSGASTST